ncbi:CdaR family transcriptional regulator [Brevibacillus sp. NRS-1366]|uniref:CdaR family transcriptional regulator n=1 Tax=Brevibacillus sp. NRS-1366 TaxID=3233899 RepID=UPI003D242B7C
MLTEKIAQQIVRETMNRLNRNINIMDNTGTIIASGDPARVNQIHEGASDVIRTKEPLLITKDNQQHYKGARPGINLPIHFQDQIIGVIGITGNPEEILEFGELVKMITEMMINQSFLASQIEWKQRMKEMVFEELVKAEPNYDAVEQRLNLLKVKLKPPFHVSLIQIGEIPLQSQELIQRMEVLLDDQHLLVGFLKVNRLFILTSDLAEQAVKRKLETIRAYMQHAGIPFHIGLGSGVMERGEIGRSREEATLALLLGDGKQGVTAFADIENLALIDRIDSHVKQKYAERVLTHMTPKLIETLEAFLSNNLSITETAKTMCIHRNTLLYRLSKIKDLTGYDPQAFQDAVSLQLAVWIHQIRTRTDE